MSGEPAHTHMHMRRLARAFAARSPKYRLEDGGSDLKKNMTAPLVSYSMNV